MLKANNLYSKLKKEHLFEVPEPAGAKWLISLACTGIYSYSIVIITH